MSSQERLQVRDAPQNLHKRKANQSFIGSLPQASSKPELKYPWQRPVFNALVKCESARLQERMIEADCAIAARLLQSPADPDELSALRAAFFALQLIYPVGDF